MSKEVIRPSVKLEEVVNVANNLRNDLNHVIRRRQTTQKKKNASNVLSITEDGVVEFINEYREIQYKGAQEVDEEGDRHFWKQITHHLVINEIVEQKIIPQFKPYISNRIPSKEEIEEFDANNEKMKNVLRKKTRRKEWKSKNQWTGQRR